MDGRLSMSVYQLPSERRALRLACSQAAPKHRPVPARIAIVLFACLLVPVLVLLAELIRGWVA